ncbi:MAG TPA: TCR/Tet family MFS transporter [Polyangiales bacterium]|nr:TCR/Tet family MFS transporter [Polyangiales bacterium]
MDAPVRRERSPLIFVFLALMIDTIGFGIIMPVLPQLIMQISNVDVGAAARIGGALLAVFAGLQFLFGPVIGNLSDRFGRRPVLLSSMLVFGVNYALMGFAPSIGWLFVGRALTGISGAIYAPANAFIADVTPPDRRAQGFGLIGAAFGFGFILGPAIGGILAELGPRAPFFAAALLALVNFAFGFFVLPETLPRERRRAFDLKRANPLGTLRAFRGQPFVLGVVIAAFFWQLAFQVYPSTWSYYAIAKFDLSARAIGATLAMTGLSSALVQSTLTGRAVKKLGERRMALFGVAWGAVMFLSFAFITQSWMLYPVLALSGLQGFANPSINALLSRELGPERQGELQGGMASVIGLSSIVAPFSLTQTLALFTGPNARFVFPGAAFVLAAVLASICFVLLTIALARKSVTASDATVA